MTTITPSSSHFRTAVKNRSVTHDYETPAFAQGCDPLSSSNDETPTSSKKKVIYTPKAKAKEHAKEGLTCAEKVLSIKENSSSPASCATIRTVCKNAGEGNQSKAQSFASTLASTPSATSRRLETTQDVKEAVMPDFQFGKRKIQYLDDLDDPEYDSTDDEQGEVEEVDSEATTEGSFVMKKKSPSASLQETKRVKPNSDENKPVVSEIFLFNFNGTKSYSFPVFRDSDLNVKEEWQTKLREADIDNDCETEQEILDYSIYQAKKDLVKGIQMQREEHTQLLKTAQKTGRMAFSQELHGETAKKSEKNFEWKDQKVENNNHLNVKQQEDEGFFAKVSRNFRDLLCNSDKK